MRPAGKEESFFALEKKRKIYARLIPKVDQATTLKKQLLLRFPRKEQLLPLRSPDPSELEHVVAEVPVRIGAAHQAALLERGHQAIGAFANDLRGCTNAPWNDKAPSVRDDGNGAGWTWVGRCFYWWDSIASMP